MACQEAGVPRLAQPRVDGRGTKGWDRIWRATYRRRSRGIPGNRFDIRTLEAHVTLWGGCGFFFAVG